jgi:hypothetical protein
MHPCHAVTESLKIPDKSGNIKLERDNWKINRENKFDYLIMSLSRYDEKSHYK